MSINKVMVYVFCVVVSATTFAMELEKSQDVKRTRPKDIVNRPAENSSSSYSLSFSFPTLSDLGNGINSLVNTGKNYWYDEEAFKKLGWPTYDKIAQQELVNTIAIYDRFNNYLKTRQVYENLTEDRRAIGRRYGYCQRVLEALPQITKRAEALELATFCLNTHGQAMNDFLKSDFFLFVDVEKSKSIQEVQRADLELAKVKIVSENLNNLYEQTTREHQKEEEKKEESKKDNGKKEQKNNGKK